MKKNSTYQVMLLCFQAQGFMGELQDVLMKINDLESQLITSKPVGGLPETAKEQLDKFMVGLCFVVVVVVTVLVVGGRGRGGGGVCVCSCLCECVIMFLLCNYCYECQINTSKFAMYFSVLNVCVSVHKKI